jgi:arylformamidase
MARVIDLTLPLSERLPGVSFEPARTLDQDGWNATTLHLYSHCGTHMDAPLHFGVSEQSIDQISLARCIGPAWLVKLDEIAARALIRVDDLGSLAERIRPGDGLLLRTGWSRRLGEPAYRDELPRVSWELARWCVERGVRLLGVEPPSVADVHDREEVTAVHRELLGGGVLVVEGLTNLDQIRSDRVTLMTIPLKIAGGDGSPVRAFAIEDGGPPQETAR